MFFKEFYNASSLIQESLDKVPRKVLGMSTDIKDLPDYKPYGFWVDRSGNYLEVRREDHITGFHQIINNAKEYLKSQGEDYRPILLFKTLFENGWLRVVLSAKYVYYQKADNHTLTQYQKRFLMTLNDLYDKEGILNDA